MKFKCICYQLVVGLLWAGAYASPANFDFESSLAKYFDLQRVRQVDQYKLASVELVHQLSKAEILLLISPEESTERTFAISFRTPVYDNKGKPHILEHSVLSGSELFPSKFVISEVDKSSVATFINALTYPDRTVFPISTNNAQDFLNLAHVYLDSVFFPLVLRNETIFMREGWHFELNNVNGTLQRQGVVLNEMKGVYSDPKTYFLDAVTRNLFANSTYAYTSGGRPTSVTDLTYKELIAFYYQHYHPGNSRIFYYGPASRVHEFLRMLHEYLTRANARYANATFDKSSTLPQPPVSIDGPIYRESPMIPEESTPKDSVTVMFDLGTTNISLVDRIGLEVMSHVLIGKRIAPLYSSLEKSQIGTSVLNYGFFDYSQNYLFGAGIGGINPTNGDAGNQINQIISDELHKIYNTGIPTEAVRSALDLFEFKIREDTSKVVKKGLRLLSMVLDEWTYDRDPLRSFNTLEALQTLRSRIESGEYVIESLIKQYLMDNQKRMTLRMVADPTLDKTTIETENAETQRIMDSLTDIQKLAIIKNTQTLKIIQATPDSPEDIRNIPRLSVDDISKDGLEYPLQVLRYRYKGPIILRSTLPTAGIVHTRLLFDMRKLHAESLDLIPLLNHLLSQPSSSKHSQSQLAYLVEGNFGELDFSTIFVRHQETNNRVGDRERAAGFWSVSFKCMAHKYHNCMEILGEVLWGTAINETRQNDLKNWLVELAATREGDISSSPADYAAKRLGSKLSLSGRIDERLTGITSLAILKELVNDVTNNWPRMERKLNSIRYHFLRNSEVIVSVGCDEQNLRPITTELEAFIDPLFIPQRPIKSGVRFFSRPNWANQVESEARSAGTFMEGFPIRSLVSYVYLGMPLYKKGESAPFKHVVPASILSNEYFFPQIRMIGGAYGASISLNSRSGDVVFSTYRDPHVQQSIDGIYNASRQALILASRMTDKDISLNIIKTIGAIDRIISHDAQMLTIFKRWLTSETAADRQNMRNEIMSTSTQDLADFGKKLGEVLSEKPTEQKVSLVCFGPSSQLERASIGGVSMDIAKISGNQALLTNYRSIQQVVEYDCSREMGCQKAPHIQ